MFRQFSPTEFNHGFLQNSYWIQLLKLNEAVEDWSHDKKNKEKQQWVLMHFGSYYSSKLTNTLDNETERAKEKAAWADLYSLVGTSHDNWDVISKFIGDASRYAMEAKTLTALGIALLSPIDASALMQFSWVWYASNMKNKGTLKDWNASNFLTLISRLREVLQMAEISNYKDEYEQYITNLRVSIEECRKILRVTLPGNPNDLPGNDLPG
jgi:hypothetical protein